MDIPETIGDPLESQVINGKQYNLNTLVLINTHLRLFSVLLRAYKCAVVLRAIGTCATRLNSNTKYILGQLKRHADEPLT